MHGVPSARLLRMKERIQKVLANAGVASRRNVEEMVLQGRVAVNGRTVRELPVLVDAEKDKVEVDGERVKLGTPKTEKRAYFVMNKPKGVHTTNVAQGEQTRAIDLLPPNLGTRVYPVGRLDSESKGLLLLTNDGDLTNQLTHPRYGVAKTYRAVVDGYIQPETLEELEKGIWLADKGGKGFKTGRSQIRVSHRSRESTVLEITIREGRNPQVRRVLAKLGHKVRDLMRVKMGPLTLHGLAPGQVRALTPREVRELKAMGKGKQQAEKGKKVVRGDGGDQGEG
jgi:23S rRNA pseudouridine2605 synthase